LVIADSRLDYNKYYNVADRAAGSASQKLPRFVVSQVPKSEGPGAPIFVLSGMGELRGVLSQVSESRPEALIFVLSGMGELRGVLSQVPKSEGPGPPVIFQEVVHSI
jgi:hypothetical protein